MTTIVAAVVLLHIVAWGLAGAAVVVLGRDRARRCGRGCVARPIAA